MYLQALAAPHAHIADGRSLKRIVEEVEVAMIESQELAFES